jgi:hypothetical protein
MKIIQLYFVYITRLFNNAVCKWQSGKITVELILKVVNFENVWICTVEVHILLQVELPDNVMWRELPMMLLQYST